MKVKIPKDDRVRWDTLQGAVTATDLCYLLVLHNEFGFGEKRILKLLDLLQVYYIEYRNRYCTDMDVGNVTTKAPHIVAMESDLKDYTGISYSAEMRRAEQEHKGRWHGNPFLEAIR